MDIQGFEARKRDHIRLALESANEASGGSGLDRIQLVHRALPEIDFSQVEIKAKFWSYAAASPFFISSMTMGHGEGEGLNQVLASAAEERGWPMGVGSQRRELEDKNAIEECHRLRKAAPNSFLFSNIGLSQAIHEPSARILALVESLEAGALIIHLNALQEALQPEGTPNFSRGLEAIARIAEDMPVPVIVKETGCGFSLQDFQALAKTRVAAIDVSGFGGTHWGRIEGARAAETDHRAEAAKTFAFWGVPTIDSIENGRHAQTSLGLRAELWASGGVRSGLDAAKCIALGAEKVGFAKPALESALKGKGALISWMERVEFELKVALFCTGSANPEALRIDAATGAKWQKI
jgi:isopentenyl-diphosphate delta-isomerase